MTIDTILLGIIATVLALPWTLKTAGFYEKVKKHYKTALSGFVLAGVAATVSNFISAWEGLSFISNSMSYQWTILGIEGIGTLILAVGLLGIFKELLTN